jgi:hypothetical protein
MPFFKTTANILLSNGEYFDENWMDSDKLILPEFKKWDYKKELDIKDVDIWEVIYEAGGNAGIYAAWSPYAEFYMICPGWNLWKGGTGIETYYGKGALQKVRQRAKELDMPLPNNIVWVDEEEMWLFSKQS